MHRDKKAIILLLVLGLAGCGSVSTEVGPTQTENVITSMEEEPVLSYEVPVSSPNIIINQLGYLPNGKKTAVFCGEQEDQMPRAFQVINVDTGEIAFSGMQEDVGYNPSTKEYNGYGDFSELVTPGTYYIEAPYLGHSYSFEIKEDIYQDIFQEAVKQYYYNRCGITLTEEFAGAKAHNACHTAKVVLREDVTISLDVSGGWHQNEKGSKDVALSAKNIGIMLLAYELHSEVFTDDMGIPESGNGIPDILDEIRYEIEWLIKMQDVSSGAVYAGVTYYGQESGKSVAYVEPVTMEASRAYAMAMAKFSYLYQSYDTEYATNCLKAGDRAWKYAQLNDAQTIDAWKFAAATELYRASGQQSYRPYISEYLLQEKENDIQDVTVFIGSVAYISTKQPVNVELCNKITKQLMQRAEDISAQARDSWCFTEGNAEQDNNDELLQNMMVLTMVNQIISNHEYKTIIMNHLHYFMGENRKSICYIDQVGSKNYKDIDENLGIMKQFEEDSKLIFMLSEILCD